MVNQLGKFIPQLAEMDKPLRDLLSKQNYWIWWEDQARAINTLKEDLQSMPALNDLIKETKISADASNFGLEEMKWRVETCCLCFQITFISGEDVCSNWKRSTYFNLGMGKITRLYRQINIFCLKQNTNHYWASWEFKLWIPYTQEYVSVWNWWSNSRQYIIFQERASLLWIHCQRHQLMTLH